jgi:hypothetical protein
MCSRMRRLASVADIVVALSGQGLAQPAAPKELSGTIHGYLVTSGERWHVSGQPRSSSTPPSSPTKMRA